MHKGGGDGEIRTRGTQNARRLSKALVSATHPRLQIKLKKDVISKINKSGGSGGIRTPGRRKPSTVFKTASFDHSDTLPKNL